MLDKVQSDRIEKVVELRAPVARVWRALTDFREFGQWFRVALDGPFAVGAVSTGTMTYPGFEGWPWEAVVERMDEEQLFSFFWPHPVEPGALDPDTPRTRVEFRLEPIPTGTRLTITESGFSALPDPLRGEAMRGNRQGWDIQAGNIAAHVEG